MIQSVRDENFTGSSKKYKDNNSYLVNSVNSMWITGTITAKQKVRQNVPGLYVVCR